jgi:glycosyltransferase involved in cell wall biosynthesis
MVVKNGELYLSEALDSVFQSVCIPDEILLIDGDSTDATVKIAKQYPRVNVIHQTCTGIANAYNQGIKASSGAFLTFLSHDDVWLAGKLERQLEAMLDDPTVMYGVTLLEHFVQAGIQPPPGFRPDLLNRPVPGFLMESLMARRSVFEQIGGFNPKYVVSEDSDWFMRARDADIKFGVVPEVLVRKRVHRESATNKPNPFVSRNLLSALRQSISRKRASTPNATPNP